MQSAVQTPPHTMYRDLFLWASTKRLVILWQIKKRLFTTSSQETDSGLGKNCCMGSHTSTGGDSSGNNGVFRFRDSVTGTKQGGHVVPIAQNSQVGLGISMERAAFCKPFNNSSNVLNCMRVSTWNIPENREEATSQWFFMDDELTKVPTCPIERDQLRVPRTNHCLISDVGAVAFFDDLVSCALGSAGNSETREQRTRLPAVPAIV